MVKAVTEIVYCDICVEAGAKEYSFVYDRRCDAAGSMENWWHDADLCAVHFNELVRVNSHPDQHRIRVVGRSGAIAYGAKVKEWIESYRDIWGKMSPAEKRLSVQIERLDVQTGGGK